MRAVARYLSWMLVLSLVGHASSETTAELKARADTAHGGERAALSMEYAHRQLEEANNLYNQGDVEKAEAAVQEVLAYAQQAATAATTSGKRLKQTEIDLRKLEHRLRDIGQSLNIDDRPPVEKGVQQLEQIRASLLAKMFGEKAEPKDKS
jgi:predicted MarR family transcription regulator